MTNRIEHTKNTPLGNPDAVLHLIDVLSAHLNRSPATLSTKILGNGKRYEQLSCGSSGIMMKTYKRAIQSCHDSWPDDLSWPVNVERPETRGAVE